MASRGPSPPPPPPPPPIHAYWFYSSPFPLDDPLAPFPIPTAATAAIKYSPRPFARYDSLALEAAYQDLLVTQRAREAEYERSQAVSTPAASFFRGRTPKIIRRESSKSTTSTTSAKTIKEVAKEGKLVFKGEGVDATGVVIPDGPVRKSSASTLRFSSSTSSSLSVGLGKLPGMGLGISPNVGLGTPPNLGRGTSPGVGLGTSPTVRLGTSPSLGFGTSPNLGLGTSPNTSGTTRTPFIRSLTQSRASTLPPPSRSLSPSRQPSVKKPTPPPSPPIQVEIPVGIQRLHQVLLPSFLMTPIYWSPLQDIASVMRGTWFYGETMLPVDAEAANRLEAGWEEVRAWTEEWEMELTSAVEVGREGEEKVRWQLWTKEAAGSRPGSALGESSGEGMGGFDPEPAKMGVTGSTDASRAGGVRADAADWVLFANGMDAYICRDSMLSFGNKRPLANIRRGRPVGTHVVRGFQQEVWERLNPSVKKRKVPASGVSATGRKWSTSSTVDSREKKGYRSTRRPMSASPAPVLTPSVSVREEMEGLGPDDEDRIPVTDLFLVIHGIGQKLSERVESFHFTHAINSFRRHINVELKDPAVRPHLRDGGKVGMMVLPVNWRHNLSFEDGLPNSSSAPSDFTLADITPPSIPAVRNLIGDVMLDIPYYLSHHKQKMIRAVVKEANRVWRLWCANNPGFEKVGRVHIIAHSLGTAIAMDILSQQPTNLDREWEGLTVGKGGKGGTGWGRDGGKDVGVEDQFDFDTKSVFFVGSPAGFFLLLNKRTLLPRRGRNKPGSDGSDQDPGVTAEAGTYGCMAADNIYNVMHQSDPIAYRLNPTVDVDYATSLRTAYVPSTATTFLDTLSSTFRSVLPSSAPSYGAPGTVPAPPPIPRLPSTIELETHDFSREELAEKRLYLLNDNGQIDWFLQEGQGALENQYLNMLGAHSSYWESRDFVRFCVVEAGRREGRAGALKGMGVAKKRGWGK